SRATRNTPPTFTWNRSSSSDSSISGNDTPHVVPALPKPLSTCPKRSMVASRASNTASSSETSHSKAALSPSPRGSNSWTAFSAAARSLAHRATEAPALARPRARPRPMPLLPPVTTATRPLRSKRSMTSTLKRRRSRRRSGLVSAQGGGGRQDGTGPQFEAGGLGQDGYQGSALDSRTDGAIGPDGERRQEGGQGGGEGSETGHSRQGAHRERPVGEHGVQRGGAFSAQDHGQSSLSGAGVGVDVATVVRHQDCGRQHSHRHRCDPSISGCRHVVHEATAHGRYQTEEDEHDHLAQTLVPVGNRATDIGQHRQD